MKLRQVLDDGQAQTVAGHGLVQPHAALEYPLAIGGGIAGLANGSGLLAQRIDWHDSSRALLSSSDSV